MSDKKQDLRKRVKKAREDQPATEGNERTAGGIEVPTPSREDFLANLKKVSKPEKA